MIAFISTFLFLSTATSSEHCPSPTPKITHPSQQQRHTAAPPVQEEAATVGAEHSAVSLELAKKESAEHMEGMAEVYQFMRTKPLTVKAFALDDVDAPLTEEGKKNVKVVHFVRHGQGFHNLMADLAKGQGSEWTQYTVTPENPYVMPEILDAPLTEKGRRQARILQPRIKALPTQPKLVVLSPNCRALQTGLIAFEHLLPSPGTFEKPTVPFLAHEMVREENGVHVCDKRRPTSQQAMEFPQVDFSLLETEDDVLFRTDRRETKMDVGERVYKFMEWLSERDEEHVAVTSHSAWLMTVFNGICVCEEKLKAWFQTGEMRSVALVFEWKEV